MPNTIANVYVQTFERNVRHVAQQSDTKLRMYCQNVSTTGEKHNWETLGAATAAKKTTRLQDTPVGDLAWGRRVSVAETWDTGESTEQADPVQMLIDPNSNLTSAIGMALKRATDDVIIAAATGTALDGAGVSNAFPAGQLIGDGTAPISFDMVTAVQEKFMLNDIDPSEPKIFVVGPTQVRKLMQLTEQTSSDYVKAQALQDYGIVPNWLGFTWINSTRLLVPAGTQRSCLAMTRRAMGLQINKDINVRIAEDPSKSFAWRIYAYMVMGSVRVEDKHIVHVKVKDTLV